MSEETQKTVEVLKNGGLVIFPRDTAVGIGCRIDDEKAAERACIRRKRREKQATMVMV